MKSFTNTYIDINIPEFKMRLGFSFLAWFPLKEPEQQNRKTFFTYGPGCQYFLDLLRALPVKISLSRV